jgi:hypothetical protein
MNRRDVLGSMAATFLSTLSGAASQAAQRAGSRVVLLALQLLFLRASESMGNHDSKVVDADSVD